MEWISLWFDTSAAHKFEFEVGSGEETLRGGGVEISGEQWR